MDIKITKDEEGAIIGFDLSSTCCTEEDFFIFNLPQNLAEGIARFDFNDQGMVVENGLEGTQSFKISQHEAKIIKAYIESDETMPAIKLVGFNRTARITFDNEKVRKQSLSG
jgi:hypothetical protein